eukprot:c6452_g1_i1.p1 GENE.c6452_g1_i1~~c6452_g1_i1.p1  ORF type:complete len:1187 (-),score=328.40 c6452_g1_i1:226-3786(-)
MGHPLSRGKKSRKKRKLWAIDSSIMEEKALHKKKSSRKHSLKEASSASRSASTASMMKEEKKSSKSKKLKATEDAARELTNKFKNDAFVELFQVRAQVADVSKVASEGWEKLSSIFETTFLPLHNEIVDCFRKLASAVSETQSTSQSAILKAVDSLIEKFHEGVTRTKKSYVKTCKSQANVKNDSEKKEAIKVLYQFVRGMQAVSEELRSNLAIGKKDVSEASNHTRRLIQRKTAELTKQFAVVKDDIDQKLPREADARRHILKKSLQTLCDKTKKLTREQKDASMISDFADFSELLKEDMSDSFHSIDKAITKGHKSTAAKLELEPLASVLGPMLQQATEALSTKTWASKILDAATTKLNQIDTSELALTTDLSPDVLSGGAFNLTFADVAEERSSLENARAMADAALGKGSSTSTMTETHKNLNKIAKAMIESLTIFHDSILREHTTALTNFTKTLETIKSKMQSDVHSQQLKISAYLSVSANGLMDEPPSQPNSDDERAKVPLPSNYNTASSINTVLSPHQPVTKRLSIKSNAPIPPSPLTPKLVLTGVVPQADAMGSARLTIASARREAIKQQAAQDGVTLSAWGIMKEEGKIAFGRDGQKRHCLRPECGCTAFQPHLNSVICTFCYHTAEEHGFLMSKADYLTATQQELNILNAMKAPAPVDPKKKKKFTLTGVLRAKKDSVATVVSEPDPALKLAQQLIDIEQHALQDDLAPAHTHTQTHTTTTTAPPSTMNTTATTTTNLDPHSTPALDRKRPSTADTTTIVAGFDERTMEMQIRKMDEDMDKARKASLAKRRASTRQPFAPDVSPLSSQTNIRGIALFQALVRGHLGRKRTKFIISRAQNAVLVIRELLQTEQVYVSSLNTFKVCYITPLLSLDVVVKLGLNGLFKALDPILSTHQAFLGKMEDQLGNKGQKITFATAPLNVGKMLRELAPNLNVYAEWVNSYEKVMTTIDTARQDKKAKKVLDEGIINPLARNMDISSYCIMPIQRIPRYELLIKELIKNTSTDRIEYGLLRHAHTMIKDMADVCNEGKRSAEQMQKAHNILQCLKKPPKAFAKHQTTARRFIHEGLVRIYIEGKLSGNADERYMFVFSDVLLWCSETSFNGTSITYRDHIFLEHGKTQVRTSVDLVRVHKAKPELKESLHLALEVAWGKQQIFIFFRTKDEKMLWQNSIVDELRDQ